MLVNNNIAENASLDPRVCLAKNQPNATRVTTT
jgi:hypothetical protein